MSCSCSSRRRNVSHIFLFSLYFLFYLFYLFSFLNIEFHLPLGMPRSCFPCSNVISAIYKFSHFLLLSFRPTGEENSKWLGQCLSVSQSQPTILKKKISFFSAWISAFFLFPLPSPPFSFRNLFQEINI